MPEKDNPIETVPGCTNTVRPMTRGNWQPFLIAFLAAIDYGLPPRQNEISPKQNVERELFCQISAKFRRNKIVSPKRNGSLLSF